MIMYAIFGALVVLFIGMILVIVNQKRITAQQDKVANWLANRFLDLNGNIQQLLAVQAEESTLTCQGCIHHQSSLGIPDENFDGSSDLTKIIRKHYCKRYQNDCRDAVTGIEVFPRRRIGCIRGGDYRPRS